MPIVPLAAGLGLVFFSLYLLTLGKSILLPFVFALFLWGVIKGLTRRLQKLRIQSFALSGAFAQTVALLVLGLGLWGLAESIITQGGAVAKSLPSYQALLQEKWNALPIPFLRDLGSVQDLLAQLNLAQILGRVSGALVSAAGNIAAVFLYLLFILLEQRSFQSKVAAFCSTPEQTQKILQLAGEIDREIAGYLWMKTLTSTLTAGLSYAVMAFYGLDHAGFWAICILGLNFIPYLGSVFGVLLPTVLGLLQFPGWESAAGLGFGLLVIQIFVGNLLEPHLMGRSFNLSPLVMLLGLSVMGSLWGLGGMFFSVPALVSLMLIFSHFESTRSLATLLSRHGISAKPK